MSEQIFVSGATGTTGQETLKALVAAGNTPRAAARNDAKAKRVEALGGVAAPFDFDDTAAMAASLEGLDRLFLVHPARADEASLIERVLTAAKASGVTHVVYLSAIGASPDAPFEFARRKAHNEALIKESGLTWTILQPTFFQSNHVVFQSEPIRTTGQFYGAAGEGRVSFVSPRDIGAVAAAALRDPATHAGQTYVLTGPEALSEHDVATLLSEASGRPVRYVDVGPEAHEASVREWAAPWQVDLYVGLETIKREGWAEAVSPTIEEVLGRPAERFAEFLEANPGLVDNIRA